MATTTAARLRLTELSPAYWRVTFQNPPVNLFDPEMFAELRLLMDRIDETSELKVVVFDSADPDYYLAHIDLLRWQETAAQPGGAPYSRWPAFVTRLTNSPVISIASIRGRARGHGHEFTLACDMRFASREKAVFGQLEVALNAVPGGGGIEWLSTLAGRSRALEVILGSDDFDADTAESYGWINRALPDSELDDVVDRLARRIASFDPDVLRLAKQTVNARAAMPTEAERAESNTLFHAAAAAGQAARKPEVGTAFERGLQERGDFEERLGHHLGLLDTAPATA